MKLPKVLWVATQKKLGLRRTRPSPNFAQNGPITPKIPWTLSPLDMSTYTEFGPDRLRFAGLIPERFFSPKSNYNIGFQPTINCHAYNLILSKFWECLCLLLHYHSGQKCWVSSQYQCRQVHASHQDFMVDQKQLVLQSSGVGKLCSIE